MRRVKKMATGREVMENVVAVTKESIQNAGILGAIVSFSIGDMSIECDALREIAEKHGLPEKYLPSPPAEPDAYKKATRAAERKFKEFSEDKKAIVREITIMVRPLISTRYKIVRKLVEEVRDAHNVRLSYREIGTATFHKETREVEVVITDPKYEYLAEDILQAYEHHKTHYDGNAIRAMVRNALSKMDPMLVRPHGGTYFIPPEYIPDAEALGDLINELAMRFRTTLWDTIFLVTPLVDLDKNRDLMSLRWHLHVKEKCRAMLNAIKLHERRGSLSENRVRDIERQLDDLIKTTKKYEELFKRSLEETRDLLKKMKVTSTTCKIDKIAEEFSKLLGGDIGE